MAASFGAEEPPDNRLSLSRLAEIYDRTAPFYDSVVAAQQATAKLAALEVLARKPNERFLEVGVGTGWAFSRVIESTGPDGAIGADVAAGMIGIARERLAAECRLVRAPLLLADVTALPFAEAAFDCLLLTYTLEVLPNAAMLPALRECNRVLAKGGRMVVLNLTPGEDSAGGAMTADWQEHFLADPEAFGGARPLRAATLLREAGFTEITRLYVGPEWPSEVLCGRGQK
jgi:ubiquinone/menaquinone biosynthesis C-methylase UbiE